MDQFQAWMNENPGHEEIVTYLTEERNSLLPGARWPNQFLLNLAVSYIDQSKPLSDGQVLSALATIRRRKDAQARIAEDASKPKGTAPLGTQTFEGEVVGIKHVENKFARGTVMKIMVDCGLWKAWGSCPKALRYVNGRHGDRPLGVGDRVQLTAEIKPSSDPSLGYFSAPREVIFLGTVNEGATR
jgi:hypothetical protein